MQAASIFESGNLTVFAVCEESNLGGNAYECLPAYPG
jgi:hypothetical protein